MCGEYVWVYVESLWRICVCECGESECVCECVESVYECVKRLCVFAARGCV